MSRQKYRKILIEIKKEIHTRQQKLIISIRGILIHCCAMVRGSVFRQSQNFRVSGCTHMTVQHLHGCFSFELPSSFDSSFLASS